MSICRSTDIQGKDNESKEARKKMDDLRGRIQVRIIMVFIIIGKRYQ